MSDEDRIRMLREKRNQLGAEISAVEDGTLPFLEGRRDWTTPQQIADEFGISVQTANNRVKKLVEFGLCRRKRVGVEGGGRAYAYRRLIRSRIEGEDGQ